MFCLAIFVVLPVFAPPVTIESAAVGLIAMQSSCLVLHALLTPAVLGFFILQSGTIAITL